MTSTVLNELAGNVQVNVVAVSTSVDIENQSTVRFPDGSSMRVKVSLLLVGGNKMEVRLTATKDAFTADGVRIPTAPPSIKNFNANSGAINMEALIDWSGRVNTNLQISYIGLPVCTSMKMECSGSSQCTVTYQCN